MNFNDIKVIYFIGIGGIGMSALARYFAKHGAAVHGYDRTATDLTRALEREGMSVHYEDDPSLIPQNVDLVVWTPAIPADHKELNWFRNNGFDLKKRAEVLGIISKARKCIAIAGTHGKTTTSTMTAYLLRACGVDVTAFVGGISGNLGSNFIEGDSDWVVVEADEYDRSFLHLHPMLAVINSVDADHLDIYGSEAAVLESYTQFGHQLKPGGTLLLEKAIPMADFQQNNDNITVWQFGIDTPQVTASNIRVEAGYTTFDLDIPQFGRLEGLQLPYPGLHNVKNATAAITATLLAGGDRNKIKDALREFKGVKRRFDTQVKTDKVVYIDDYAHHPAELEACIQAARSFYPDAVLAGIFQPHLYTRTRDFANGFAAALDKLDHCLLLPIYPARELPIEGIQSEMLIERMQSAHKHLVLKADLLDRVGQLLDQHNDQQVVLLTMGAGDIDLFIKPITERIQHAN